MDTHNEKVTVAQTKTGSQYILRNGYYLKKKHDRIIDNWTKIWHMQALTTLALTEQNPDNIKLPWVTPQYWEDIITPTIGSPLYIAGKDNWWVTTPIITVTTYDNTVTTYDNIDKVL